MNLQQLVREHRERLGLSLRDVAGRSRGRLSPNTVRAIEQGQRQRVSERTVQGLAFGLSLPRSIVQEAAGHGVADTAARFTLPPKAQRLTVRQRKHVLELIDLLLDERVT